MAMLITEVNPPRPTAEGILARSNAEAADVHAYALGEINVLKSLLARLEEKIEAKRKAREEATKEYIQSVDEAIRAARIVEDAVLAIDKAVEAV